MIRAEVRRRDDAPAILVLILIITALFATFWRVKACSTSMTPAVLCADTVLRDIVRGGEMPYWNPFISGGQPLAANPEHGSLLITHWLILLPKLCVRISL